jgi:very-short-patch-repair endonuclease
MQTLGVLVSILDMVEDYLQCQPKEWSLALVDQLARTGHLTIAEWREIENRLPAKLRNLAQCRSAIPESPLESVVRYRLTKARIPFEMQKAVGKYRVDFLIANGVVLETHGAEFHAGHESFERDRARTIWLREMGFDVIEMSYRQLDDWDRVLRVIERARLKSFAQK